VNNTEMDVAVIAFEVGRWMGSCPMADFVTRDGTRGTNLNSYWITTTVPVMQPVKRGCAT